MPQPQTDRDLRARDATRVSIAKLRAQADAAGPVDAMRLRAAADRLEADLTADEVGTVQVFTPTRQALLRVLTMVQNCPRYAEQDIMTICGLCSATEVSDHLWANFRGLPEADKARVLDALRIEANAALAEAA